jgi:antitoxin (DNA-binding transcriptional repressor) of toxin-antitoxin stability system
MKATLTDLHRKTSKVLKPVLEGGTVVLTHHGSDVAEIRPKRKANWSRVVEILRSIGPLELPSRK